MTEPSFMMLSLSSLLSFCFVSEGGLLDRTLLESCLAAVTHIGDRSARCLDSTWWRGALQWVLLFFQSVYDGHVIYIVLHAYRFDDSKSWAMLS